MIREVFQEEELDNVDHRAVAHFKRKVENCFNYTINKKKGLEPIYHPLKLKREVFQRPEGVHITERCETCGLLYSQRLIPLSRTDVLEKLGIKVPVKIQGA
jgi:hypothetical protein